MKETKDKKKFKIHKYYIISVVLIIVFVVIPWQYLKFKRIDPPLIWKCQNLCQSGLMNIEDNVCICTAGTSIDSDEWYSEVENEK